MRTPVRSGRAGQGRGAPEERRQARSGGEPRRLLRGGNRPAFETFALLCLLPEGPVLWSSEPLPLPPCVPFHISQDLFPTHLLPLFQHASSYFDIRRAAEYATSKYDTLVYFELQTFEEQQTQGDFSESPICLKTNRPLDELSQIPLPRSFINQRFISLQKGDSKSTLYQTNFVTNCRISHLFF